MPLLVYILISLLIILLVGGGYTFYIACVRRKELPWFEEEKLKKTAYGKYYQYICYGANYLREHHAQEISVTSTDGLRLSAAWLPIENAKGTIILAHGYRSCRLMEFSRVMEFYHGYGLNILLPDQRAHGKSEGRVITFGVKESDDMKKWIQWVNENQEFLPIYLSGLSMGASTMLYPADQDLPVNVKGIIADCGFTSPWDIISKVFRDVIHIPGGIFVAVADVYARVFGGFKLKQKDTRKSLKNSKLPVLIVHGAADDFVPCEMTRQAFAQCVGDKEMFLVEGAEHGLSFLVATQEYKARVRAFLDRTMKEKD